MSDENEVRVKVTDPEHLRQMHTVFGVLVATTSLDKLEPALAKLPGVSVAKQHLAAVEAQEMKRLLFRNVRHCAKQGVDMGAYAIAMIDFHAGEIICKPFDLLGDVEA